MNTYNIFPTTVGIVELEREFTKKEIDIFNNLERRPNEGNTTTVNNKVLELKEFKKLKEFVTSSVNEYFQKTICPKENVELYVTQSWVNYTEKGQFHHKHAHPNSFISGVLYLNADVTKDKIYFYKEQYQQLNVEPKEWNITNSTSWWFEVGTGKLILFPSSLTHMVQTIDHDETRISLAFNTFLKGKLGTNNTLTELILGD
jgi:uncharacterized protein (TIGR02466 family)